MNLAPSVERKELDHLFPASPSVAKTAPLTTRTRCNKILPSFPHLTEHHEEKREDEGDSLLAMLPCGVRQCNTRKLKHVNSLSTSFFTPAESRRKFLEISPYKKTKARRESGVNTTPLDPILKPSSFVKKRLDVSAASPNSSEESTESIPSLASTECSEDEHAAIAEDDCCISTPTSSPTPTIAIHTTKGVAFDPRIWICEFRRSREEFGRTWYSPLDMDKFKRAALQRVMELQAASTELIPTGTGRFIRRASRPVSAQMSRALFTNPALSSIDDDDDDDEVCLQRLGKQEIRHVLVVDPHDICLKLFAKSIKAMLPHVSIATARTSEEAMRRLGENKLGFDMVIVEERLKLLFQGEAALQELGADSSCDDNGRPAKTEHLVSGAALFQVLKECTGSKTLFVGVTSQPDKYDEKLRTGGADVVWSKPPPAMDKTMRDSLLKMILNKRGKKNHVAKHFV